MATADPRVVVAGAGHAAGTVAASLRQWGHRGDITLVGDEAALPYQRPPLSKTFLKGLADESDLYLRPATFYEKSRVTVRSGRRVEQVDRDRRVVALDDGSRLPYDKLVIATGARPRTVPVTGAELDGVLSLRTLADVRHLRGMAAEDKRLVVIGAGYIGLEAASVARSMGMTVTVLEVADRVLARVTSPEVSRFYQDLHREAGVDIRLNASLAALHGTEAGAVREVDLSQGERLPADIVLMGVGIVPNVELAQAAGLACDDGIDTDDESRTADPDIYAVGDCANRWISSYGFRGRLESVHNAVETAKIAAASICARPSPRLDAPWFWSDQYDVKLQTAGLLGGYDTVLVRGEVASRSFSVWYFKDSRFLAVDAINVPADFMAGKALAGRAAVLDADRLVDTSVDIRALVADALPSLAPHSSRA